ncbi:unnamed protein product [Eruca vesicaria subsp. sativa]|uniref:Uncharacterized protein n=1 Tax=Eruca vesicaria subsp. sativa TaxID=29727 RepID=A0ABC8JIE9_ERUVS|nr:unnamed protein product [Eruca vesicaria subsp. sativa]
MMRGSFLAKYCGRLVYLRSRSCSSLSVKDATTKEQAADLNLLRTVVVRGIIACSGYNLGYYLYSPADPETQPRRPRSNPPEKSTEHLAHMIQSARLVKRLHEENVDGMSKALSSLVQSHARLEEQLLRTKSKPATVLKVSRAIEETMSSHLLLLLQRLQVGQISPIPVPAQRP